MKEFTVNLDHITRQQVTVCARSKEEAVMLVQGMFQNTDALDHLPVVSTSARIVCGDVMLPLPTVLIMPTHFCEEDQEEDEINLIQLVCNARDEVEEALEYLDSALSDLYATQA